MRELVLRMERSERRHSAEIAHTLREHQNGMAAIREDLREIAAELRDHRGEWRAEQKAQHRALFAILDRLDRGGGAAPA